MKKLLVHSALAAVAAAAMLTGTGNMAAAYPGQCPQKHYCYDSQIQLPEQDLDRVATFYFHNHDTTGHNFTLDRTRIENNEGNPPCWYWVEIKSDVNVHIGGNYPSGAGWDCNEVHNLAFAVPDTAVAYVYMVRKDHVNGGRFLFDSQKVLLIAHFRPVDCGTTPCN